MVPTETLVSMLDEPSSGSTATTRLPEALSGIGVSLSSEPRKATGASLSFSMTASSAITSSSFWVSPPALASSPRTLAK